jgi:hypothetical protein
MRILINHLTRMKQGYVCVAGLDENGIHVRPVAGQLPRSLVSVEGGPFDLGTIVELGSVRHTGNPPEVEDHSFSVAQLRRVKVLPGDEFWATLEKSARPSLPQIFGDELVKRSKGATVDPSEGKASLGVVRPSGHLSISRSGFGAGLRIGLTDEDLGTLDLSLTDLRFVDSSHKNVDEDSFEEASRRLNGGEAVLLSVGLARAFQAQNDTRRRHWLQVNNLHFEGHRDWRLDSP